MSNPVHPPRPAFWPEDQEWPPADPDAIRRALQDTRQGLQRRVYCWVDQWGRIMAIRKTGRELDPESESPRHVARGETLVELPVEFHDRVQTQSQRIAYVEGAWIARFEVRFTCSMPGGIFADGVDAAQFMVLGVPDDVERVRCEVDGQETWIAREDGVFMLVVKAAQAGTVAVQLVDARFFATPDTYQLPLHPPPPEDVT